MTPDPSVPPFLPFSRPTGDAVGDVLRAGSITSCDGGRDFGARLSAYLGRRPVRTFNSGTCTMEIALPAVGAGAGDEVISTLISLAATADVIRPEAPR